MRFFTSYFYMVRFFTPETYGLSTAMWDPKWFHDFKGQDHIFRDSHNVLNGLRCDLLVPGSSCDGLCHGPNGCGEKPDSCRFLENYYNQLKEVGIDKIVNFCDEAFSGKDVDIVFLFHETPDNPCSERVVVQKFFKENGFPISEWYLGI